MMGIRRDYKVLARQDLAIFYDAYITKKPSTLTWLENFGAGNESRTRDLNLGKVALYQLSYSRIY